MNVDLLRTICARYSLRGFRYDYFIKAYPKSQGLFLKKSKIPKKFIIFLLLHILCTMLRTILWPIRDF